MNPEGPTIDDMIDSWLIRYQKAIEAGDNEAKEKAEKYLRILSDKKKERKTIASLAKLADSLDKKGLLKEADLIDKIIKN